MTDSYQFPRRPAPPPARRRDDVQPQYWTMLALGATSAVLLLLGLTNLAVATMPWAHIGAHAEVTGVFPYDRDTGEVSGSPRLSFPKGATFAARVNWAALPGDATVGAIWYDANQSPVGGITPAPASTLAARHQAVPMADVQAPPGPYEMLVLHYVDNQAIEVLGRTDVRIAPS